MTAVPAFIIHYGDYKPGGIVFLIVGLVAFFVINIDRGIRQRLSSRCFQYVHVAAMLNNTIGMYIYLGNELYSIAVIIFPVMFIFWFKFLKGSRRFDW